MASDSQSTLGIPPSPVSIGSEATETERPSRSLASRDEDKTIPSLPLLDDKSPSPPADGTNRPPHHEGAQLPSSPPPQQPDGPSPAPAPAPAAPLPHSGVLLKTRNYLNETVRVTILVEVELLLLTFCIGIQDAVSFPDYHAFASNQTGNTVFLAVALVIPTLNGDTFYTANIAVSLGLFLAGGYLTGQLSHLVGPRRRGWLVFCNFLQTLLAFAAAWIQWDQLRRKGFEKVPPTGPESLSALALLAFASGSQVVQSRSMQMTEISTAMATAAWVDLLIDPHLFALREPNRPRNRRFAFLLTLVFGSLLGAGLYRTAGSDVAIFISVGGKAVVTIMYLFNGSEEQAQQKSQDDENEA